MNMNARPRVLVKREPRLNMNEHRGAGNQFNSCSHPQLEEEIINLGPWMQPVSSLTEEMAQKPLEICV